MFTLSSTSPFCSERKNIYVNFVKFFYTNLIYIFAVVQNCQGDIFSLWLTSLHKGLVWSMICMSLPEALCFGVVRLSLRPSFCLSVWNLVNTITPECMMGISWNLVEAFTMIWQWTDYILGFTDRRARSPQDQIWAKIQFWSHISIQMYQAATFVNGKDWLGHC